MRETVTSAPEGEEWRVLLSFLPSNWRELAVSSGALHGLRKDKSPESLLRTLLIHLGCGHSLRETVARARLAQVSDLSDVALMKRLRKSKDWLYAMCMALFEEHGVAVSTESQVQTRAFDATIVREPGKTGSQWRLHYSITLPALGCDFFRLTGTKGPGTGESFKQFPVQPGDLILADRCYATGPGLHYLAQADARVIVRVNTGVLRFLTPEGEPFDLLNAVETIQQAGKVGTWNVAVQAEAPLNGRLCALRKTPEAIQEAHEQIRRTAARKGNTPQDCTWRFACYVLLFTTFPEQEFPASKVLEWYRLRWQVELVFKRFKSLAQLGHLPKFHKESVIAWLYGKLLVALLTEKIVRHARTISPWGYDIELQYMA